MMVYYERSRSCGVLKTRSDQKLQSRLHKLLLMVQLHDYTRPFWSTFRKWYVVYFISFVLFYFLPMLSKAFVVVQWADFDYFDILKCLIDHLWNGMMSASKHSYEVPVLLLSVHYRYRFEEILRETFARDVSEYRACLLPSLSWSGS